MEFMDSLQLVLRFGALAMRICLVPFDYYDLVWT